MMWLGKRKVSAAVTSAAATVVVTVAGLTAFTATAGLAHGKGGSRAVPAPTTRTITPPPRSAMPSSPPASPPASAPASPSGAPTAALSPTGPLHVVALGDSVPAGTACACTPFVQLFGTAVAGRTGRTVEVTNAGVPGLNTSGFTAQLAGGAVARTVAASDIVTITIGANDFDIRSCAWGQRLTACYASTLARMRDNLDHGIARIKALRAGRPTTILVTGYWNIWKDGAVARGLGAGYERVSDALTRAVNAAIAGVAAKDDVDYVDLYAPFKGSGDVDDTDLLAADGDHPNAAGHAVIAQALFLSERWVRDPALAPA